jgi:hypothetical protein
MRYFPVIVQSTTSRSGPRLLIALNQKAIGPRSISNRETYLPRWEGYLRQGLAALLRQAGDDQKAYSGGRHRSQVGRCERRPFLCTPSCRES